jgi:FAD/FMN-containing dehydrogenase
MTMTTRLTQQNKPVRTADLRLIQDGFFPLDHYFGAQREQSAKQNAPHSGGRDLRPAVIARCQTRRDIQAAIRTAQAHGLSITVGGGERAQAALTPGELIVDLSSMRQVRIDAAAQIATVDGGATVNDVVAAAATHGLVAVTGLHGAMRMVSQLPGGGYGPLLGRCGTTADNVLEAEIVLESGQPIIASRAHNSELFQKLCSGATGLGIVTSLRVRLHALPLRGGMVFYAWSDADLVLRGYSAIAASAPECLTVCAGIVSQSEGGPLLFVAPTWCGEPDEGADVLAALQRFGNPVSVDLAPTRYIDLLAMYERHLAGGSNYSIRRRWFPELSVRAIAALITAANARTSPLSAIVLHHFHGVAGRKQTAAGTFGLRQPHFLAEAIASWDLDTDGLDAGHRLRAQNLTDELVPVRSGGRSPPFLASEEHA